jgi:hypothetical protein
MNKIKYTYHNHALIIGDQILEISLVINNKSAWLNFKSNYITAKELLIVDDAQTLIEKLEKLNFPQKLTSMGIIMMDGYEETIDVDDKLIIKNSAGDINFIEPFKLIVNMHLGYDLFEMLENVSLIGINNQLLNKEKF